MVSSAATSAVKSTSPRSSPVVACSTSPPDLPPISVGERTGVLSNMGAGGRPGVVGVASARVSDVEGGAAAVGELRRRIVAMEEESLELSKRLAGAEAIRTEVRE